MKTPKFTVPTWPIDSLDPWKGTDTEGPEFTQLYVTRDLKEIECVAEVTSCSHRGDEADHNETDCIKIGDCFDLRGQEIILTLEEQDEARQNWLL